MIWYHSFAHSVQWFSPSADIAHSRTLAVGFHYETYGEIIPSHTLSYTLYCYRADQFDFVISDRFSYDTMLTASLGTARWADLSTLHPIIDVETSDSDSFICHEMSPSVLRWAHLTFPTMPYAYTCTNCSAMYDGYVMCNLIVWENTNTDHVSCNMAQYSTYQQIRGSPEGSHLIHLDECCIFTQTNSIFTWVYMWRKWSNITHSFAHTRLCNPCKASMASMLSTPHNDRTPYEAS